MQTSPDPATPSVVAALALLDELVRLGVRHVVLAPGSRSAPLAYAAQHLERTGALTLHVRVDERAAAFTALGLAKVSRVPAAVVTTSGTAVANLHPAVLEADHGQVPLLLLTADRPPELRGVGANQATDQVGIFGPARTRLFVDLETPAGDRLAQQCAALRTTAARAVSAATGGEGGEPVGAVLAHPDLAHPGPVHLNLPYRDPLVPGGEGVALPESCRGRDDGGPWVRDLRRGHRDPRQENRDPRQAHHDLSLASERQPGTRLPDGPGTLAVIGDLPTAGHRRAAFAWASAHGVPVLAEPGSPPPPEHADVLLPHGTLALHAEAWRARHPVRSLVVIGRPTLGRQVAALQRAAEEVHLVSETHSWADPTHEQASIHPFASLRTDPADAARRGPEDSWLRDWRELGRALASAAGPLLQAERLESGMQVLAAVDRAAPPRARVFLGSSSAARDHHLGLARPRADVDVVASRGLAGIDGCLSTAAGLALADPEASTIAVVGDLTFLHDATALMLGPDEPVPDLTVVVLDDRGGGIFSTLEHGAPERSADFERVFATPTRSDLCAVAQAHGWPARTVTTGADLAAALGEPARGIRVLRVPLDLGRRRGDLDSLRLAAAGID
ncbi:2-succinyl-5-enolpyruvyl-6-hydroxy-3-cyclohexene- 1-carboxylic-acid synthase [Marihabitans asiaticum]|uniref:2-succinyl-5-enolpyruvyl-6-hydroxy-3-cyclohexene-1-carboxylate synthase n=1 Tax=Marihabitans asiaticum TaxID=415218 RepID=A0A560WHU4_9MICO|nr:2-succinyl-5-enolpyruvyl-6-hydroxy-3-cyclohexene-1-carboxylic-acid synthase [Marihabitans asiaticum]TWD17130.1 2-succinyl-5-enolpyruvyl-6-hydroxy-3-cyclohexene-1-carboxylate synthase [Marihabitans asiaticum]